MEEGTKTDEEVAAETLDAEAKTLDPKTTGLQLKMTLPRAQLRTASTMALANTLMGAIKDLVKDAEAKKFDVFLIGIQLTTVPKSFVEESEKKQKVKKVAKE